MSSSTVHRFLYNNMLKYHEVSVVLGLWKGKKQQIKLTRFIYNELISH